MLFLQGTRDSFAEMNLLEPVLNASERAPRCISCRRAIIPSMCRPGRDGEVMSEVLDGCHWVGGLLPVIPGRE